MTGCANNGRKAMASTLKEGSIELEKARDTADAGFAAIKDACCNNTLIALPRSMARGGDDGVWE